MRLIGPLASPYVRRVAVSLNLLHLPYTWEDVSVFQDTERFAAINPVIKAPTFFTDDGVAIMDSSLILDYVERLAGPDRSLYPSDLQAYARAQRIVGLAMAACEKTLQIIYECRMRPQDKRHEPWLERITRQVTAAYRLLEEELCPTDSGTWLFGDRPLQADISAAVAWRFTQIAAPGTINAADHLRLTAVSERAESLAEFAASPYFATQAG
jgi:glutathione S-transferase